MTSLQDAVTTGLPPEEQAPALEELTLIRRGFIGEATPTQVTAATERLCKQQDYFRTRLQDFCWGAELLHLPADLPPFVQALKAGLA